MVSARRRRRLAGCPSASSSSSSLIVAVGADRDQLVHRVEIVDEQLAVEVVELVLERPAEEPGSGDLDLLAVAVLGDDPDVLAPGDVGVVAGEREAALEVAVVAGGPDDPRVDQLVELARRPR